jgi:hypothetical protein
MVETAGIYVEHPLYLFERLRPNRLARQSATTRAFSCAIQVALPAYVYSIYSIYYMLRVSIRARRPLNLYVRLHS